ncbi:FGGY family carbohydrate kinase [Cellvibrio mixtus]|uniref:FGGY family carbohydrate kinase n=1 Tax=Cellvibrio mixtus TaxID=39650 RepID=UPI000587A47C|nr:FGGY family carbohydrate kinase [Cellvibrio mixtus]
MKENLYLAIDQGGQSSRVGIYSETGQLICQFSAPCATQHHQPDDSIYPHIEQDGNEILHGIRQCLDKVCEQLGETINNIKAASFAGQGSSFVCWDSKTGEPLTPVLSWQDIRGEPYLRQISLTHQQAQHITGLRVSPHYGASKIRWCLDNSNAVKKALGENSLSIGPIVSFIFWHLLDGKNLVDPGHAQRTLLWNLHRNEWDERLLELFKVPKPVLPECRFHNSNFGSLKLGSHSIPFFASARDQGASLFAAGMPDSAACYVNIGTGAFIQRLSNILHAPDGLLVSPLWIPQDKCSENANASPTCYANELADKPWYAWEATVNGAASAISYLQEKTRLDVTPNEIELALQRNPGHEVYFLNAVGGLSAPYWRTDLQAAFAADLSPQEKILAWIESVIFQIVINIELMKKAGEIRYVRISGGFSKSNQVCQRLADISGLDVYRSDNADATLQGAACMATGISSRWQPDFQQEIFLPVENAELRKRFLIWQNAMKKWLNP